MTPETKDLISSYPELSEESAKLIFIRDRARKAYIENEIDKATSETLKEIITIGTVASMSKEEIGLHIKNLENCRNFLSALIQGLKIAFTEEVEPKIRAKRAKEDREKNPKTVEGILAKYGISQDPKIEDIKPTPPAEKIICPKCNAETFSLNFHTCKS